MNRRERLLARIAKHEAEITRLRQELRQTVCAFCGQEFTARRARFRRNPCCGSGACVSRSSIERISRTRDRKLEALLAVAAKYWPKWRESYGNRAEWVASQINAETGTTMQRNWVSRHAKEIERMSA